MEKPKDPALQRLLLTAQDEQALERLRLFEFVRKHVRFRVTVAGLDVTDFPGPPLLEPELQRARELREQLAGSPKEPSKRALRRKRRR